MDQQSQEARKVVIWAKNEAAELLKAYNEDTQSYGELAARFKRSKGSVAGLIGRFRAKGLVTRPPNPRIPKKEKPKGDNPIAVQLFLKKTVVAPVIKEATSRVRLRMIEDPDEVTFAELKPFHCKYPLGDPKRPDFRFCGKPKCDDAPYCKIHCSVAFTGPPQRVRRTPK